MFDYVPMGDQGVLSELIRNRMRLDRSYMEKVYPSGLLSSAGGIIFNENILSVYVDLDRMIQRAPLTKGQRTVINLLMKGWTIQDIAEETGRDKTNISHIFSRALNTLSGFHFERWRSVVSGEAEKEAGGNKQ